MSGKNENTPLNTALCNADVHNQAQQAQCTQCPQAEDSLMTSPLQGLPQPRKRLLDHGTRRSERELPTDLGWYPCYTMCIS